MHRYVFALVVCLSGCGSLEPEAPGSKLNNAPANNGAANNGQNGNRYQGVFS